MTEENAPSITKWVFATSNPHKAREAAQILEPLGIELLSLDRFEQSTEEPVEDGLTFEDNARIKARSYAAQLGLRCLAEDSGLEVDALGGRPGVHSARYAGLDGSRAERDQANNDKLLADLANVPQDRRSARFVCAVCVAEPSGEVVAEARGTYEGQVAFAPRGDGGFGYDPLLLLPDLGVTSAELNPDEKNRRSHRGKALRLLVRALT